MIGCAGEDLLAQRSGPATENDPALKCCLAPVNFDISAELKKIV